MFRSVCLVMVKHRKKAGLFLCSEALQLLPTVEDDVGVFLAFSLRETLQCSAASKATLRQASHQGGGG